MPSYSHLSSDERSEIAVLAAADHSISAIARLLGRAMSTIGRELKRNRLPEGRYSPHHADGAYVLRGQRHAAIEEDEALGRFVRDRLAEGWSPEQIAGWLKAANEPGLRGVCTETIYALPLPRQAEGGGVVALSDPPAQEAPTYTREAIPCHDQEQNLNSRSPRCVGIGPTGADGAQ